VQLLLVLGLLIVKFCFLIVLVKLIVVFDRYGVFIWLMMILMLLKFLIRLLLSECLLKYSW